MLRVLGLTRVVPVFLLIGVTIVHCRNREYLNPEWVDPHDWTGDRDPVQNLCPQTQQCEPCQNSVKSEYLRLVNSFFNPSQFHFDESKNYLYRTVHIHITKEQLEKLKKSTDPIYIDGLLAEVLAQTEFGTVQVVKEYTVDVASTIWNNMPALPSISEVNFNALPRSRPILINFVVLVLTYFVCRRFGINYLIVVFFTLIYCLYEYLDNECHRRIELNEAVEFIYGKEKNPCMGAAKMNWYDWLLGRDSRSACRDFLDRQSASETQCGVIDLFYEFTANILMKQLKLFFTTIAEMVQSISTTHGILITAVTLYFMKGLLMTIIQSVFRYVLNPTIWSRVAADMNRAQTPPTVPVQRVQSIVDSDLRDLNVSKALDLANQQMQLLLEHKKIELINNGQPSGVEVLALKAAASDVSDATSSTSTEPRNENRLTDASHITCSSQSTNHNTESPDSSNESYEEFDEDEIIKSQNVSVVSINDTQTTEMSSGSIVTTSTNTSISTTSSDRSSSSATTTTTSSDTTKSSSDSMGILSISSDTLSS